MPVRSVAQTCILVGLLPLLPVPMLDELLRRRLMRGVFLQIAEAHGHRLEAAALAPLVDDRGNLLLGCVVGLSWGLIKKLFKTVLYVLTVKELADWASAAAVQARMVERAFALGALPAHPAAVRTHMDAAWRSAGGSPLVAVLRGRTAGWGAAQRAGDLRLVEALASAAGAAAVLEHFDAALRGGGLVPVGAPAGALAVDPAASPSVSTSGLSPGAQGTP